MEVGYNNMVVAGTWGGTTMIWDGNWVKQYGGGGGYLGGRKMWDGKWVKRPDLSISVDDCSIFDAMAVWP